MKNFTAAVVIVMIVCLPSAVFSKTFRIGYPGSPVTGVDFPITGISNAISAATAGDTIQLYQHYWSGNASFTQVNKRLVFIGFGYFLNINSGLQAITAADSRLTYLQFNAGSQGSVVQGVYGYVYVNTDSISIRRSRLLACYLYDQNELRNITISQCFINSLYEYYATRGVKNITIKNSYIDYVYLENSSGVFVNNVSGQTVNLNSFLVKNNILNGCITGALNVVSNNLFGLACAGTGGQNNQFSINLNNVFTAWSFGANNDKALELKAGSPAIGAGVKNDNSATDAGIFGGETGEAYRLSGIPPVPSIYKLSATSQTANTNPYVITVSIRGNN